MVHAQLERGVDVFPSCRALRMCLGEPLITIEWISTPFLDT